MAKLSKEDIDKMTVEQATIIEDPPGVFSSTYFPDEKYDDRREAWYNAIKKRSDAALALEGRNIHGQTPEQVRAFEARKKVQEERKRKAELAAEMALQYK